MSAKGKCTNPGCEEQVTDEFVLQVSTTNIRWFCSIECIIASQEAHYDAIRRDMELLPEEDEV